MQKLKRRDADSLRARIKARQPIPLSSGLGDYGGEYDQYNEGDVFHASTPGQLQVVNADGSTSIVEDKFDNPIAFTPYPFATNNISLNGVGNGSVLILTQNRRRQALLIQNLSTGANLYVNFGSDASALNGLLLGPGEGIVFDNGNHGCPNNSVYVFFDTATIESGIIFEGAPVY